MGLAAIATLGFRRVAELLEVASVGRTVSLARSPPQCGDVETRPPLIDGTQSNRLDGWRSRETGGIVLDLAITFSIAGSH